MVKLLALFFLTIPAYGSVFMEPYVGTALAGEFEDTGVEGTYDGFGYGFKFGLQRTYFFAGVDYRLGNFNINSDDKNYFLEGEVLNNEQYYAYAGVELPAFFKLWGGVAFGGNASSNDFEFSDASGVLFGIGYKGLPVVQINMEYVSWDYANIEPGSGSNLSGSHVLISLSTPIKF